MKVKNITRSTLNLADGQLEPGEVGTCQPYEYNNLAGTYLEAVEEAPQKAVKEDVKI